MTDRLATDLAAALAVLEQAAPEVAAAEVPATVTRLAAVLAILGARLVTGRPDGETQAGPATRYVTQAEAAALFGIPLSTVRYLTRRGRVPVLGRGKNRRLLPADLARELEACQRTGRPLRPSGRPRKKPLDRAYTIGIERPA